MNNNAKMSPKRCRICSKPDNDDFISVQLVQDDVTIAEMILLISGVSVTSDRRLPQNICLQCLDRLKQAFNLRQQCIKNNARLQDELRTEADIVIEKLDAHVSAHEIWTLYSSEQKSSKKSTVCEGDGLSEKNDEGLGTRHGMSNAPEPIVASLAKTEWSEDVHFALVREARSTCCGCTMKFETTEELSVHSRQVHGNANSRRNGGNFVCTICYESFPSDSALECHVSKAKASWQVAGYECLVCSEQLCGRKELLHHLEQHAGSVEATRNRNESGSGVAMDEEGANKKIESACTEATLNATDATEEEYLMSESTLDEEEYSIAISISDESFEDDEENFESVDEEDEDWDELTTKSQGTPKHSEDRSDRSRIQRTMCRIPEKSLRVVQEEPGYQIVELLQHRCCCCAGLFQTEQQLKDHLKELRASGAIGKPDPYAKYTCEYCGKQFNYPVVFSCHRRLREQRQFYMCRFCNTLLDSATRMKSHMVHSKGHANFFNLPWESIAGRYESVALPGKRCCCCHKYFDESDEFLQHIRAMHVAPEALTSKDTRPYCCGFCERRFSNQALLDRHKRFTMDVKVHYCKLCDFETSNLRRMELHLHSGMHRDGSAEIQLEPLKNNVQKLPSLRYCCFNTCKRPFSDLASLREHVAGAHLETWKGNLAQTKILKQMLADKCFECDVCGTLFKNATSLKLHKSPMVPQQYVCSVCGVQKRSRATLLIHERSHSGERPFRCEFCDKTFTSKTTLNSHLKCHNPGSHACEICGEKFNRAQNMSRHVRLRHGEATLQCEVCQKMFKTKGTLQIHMRTHTGEKRFRCRMGSCDKRYINEPDRRRHEMAVHTHERPHKCSFCSSAFIRKRQLAIHERRHTGDKPFICFSCGKGFVDTNPLRIHQRTCTAALKVVAK